MRVPDLLKISAEGLAKFLNSQYKVVQLPIPELLKQEGFRFEKSFPQSENSKQVGNNEGKSAVSTEEEKKGGNRPKCKAIPNKKPLNIFRYGFDTKADEMLDAIVDLPCDDDYKVITNSRKAAPKGGPR